MNPTVADRRLTPAALIIGLFTGLVIWNLPIPTLRGESPEVIEVASFSSAAVGQTIPDGWTPLIFKNIPRQTKYALVKEGDITVVKAESNASASGLTRAVTIDPHEYPIIRWRWKVDHVLLHSDVSRKDGDDYPARLYVTFEYDEKRVSFSKKLKYAAGRAILGDIPIGALNYIWETRTPVGTVVENAYTDFAQMIVIESGPQHVGKWVDEERNVLNDYRMAFGEDPPLINGVAIMTDTDNTKEQVTAYYGDITFSKLPQ